jgi:hypothetical protein
VPGWTALRQAIAALRVRYGAATPPLQAMDMASFLIDHGADPNLKSPEAMKVEKGLRQNGLIELADSLCDESAKRADRRFDQSQQEKRPLIQSTEFSTPSDPTNRREA